MITQKSKFKNLLRSQAQNRGENFKSKLKITVFLTSLVLCLISAPAALAQTPTPSSNYDVTVSPVFFDLTVNPGDSVSNKIRIRNNTSSPLPIKLTVQKMTGDVNGDLTLRSDPTDQSLSWVKFTSDTFVAAPLEWTDVPFTIDIPKDAAYGYYFAINLTQDNTSPIKRTGASITGAAAVPVLLNVKKEGAKLDGKLLSLKVDKSFYEYPPIKFSTVFENIGNVHIRPTGNIFIKDWLGNQVATLTVNQTQGSILPGLKKTFEASWDDGFITVEPKMQNGEPKLDKNGKVETELKIKFDKILDLRIGRYTASELLVISTSNRDIPFTAQTSFFVFPWKVVIGAILFVIFAAIGFYSTIKNILNKASKVFGTKKNKQNEQ
jgi:hypothetical protein